MTWEERGMASDGVEITGPKRDRFDEVLTPEAVGLVAAPGQHDDGDRGRPRLISNGTTDFEAVDLRQHQVKDDRDGFEGAAHRKAFRAVANDVYAVAFGGELAV